MSSSRRVPVAEDERTASILEIPICTQGIVQHLAKTGQLFIRALRDKLRAAYEEVQWTREFGRFQDIYEDSVAKRRQVKGANAARRQRKL